MTPRSRPSRARLAPVLALLGGLLFVPARARAQAPGETRTVIATAAATVSGLTELGTTTPLVVTNRGRANGGWNIVYVAGKVASRANAAYCLRVRLTSAFPYASDISARQPDGTYASLTPASGVPVVVASHGSGGDNNDLVTFRIQSKSQLSDAEATSLERYLTYELAAPCT